MTNRKYNKIAKTELKKIDSIVTSFEINHFYLRCNKKLEQILFSALRNLKNRKLILEPEIQTVIVDNKYNYFLALDPDKKRILQEERYVLKNIMGYEKISQVFCRFKQNEYYKMVNERLNDLYGWHHYFKQIKLSFIPSNIIEAIPQTTIDLEKEILNEKIIKVLNNNAEEKYNTDKQKYEDARNNLLWGNYNSITKTKTWKIPDTYIEAQRILTEELINIGHENNRISLNLFKEDEELDQLFTSFLCQIKSWHFKMGNINNTLYGIIKCQLLKKQMNTKQTRLLCSKAEQKTLFPNGKSTLIDRERINYMNKSYRLKMEQLLSEHKLTKELLINCIAKSDRKVAGLAYKEKQYRNVGYNNFKLELDKLIQYRQPFFDVLKDGYNMTLAEIKSEVTVADVNKIPTKKVIDQIRDMIETWDYTLVQMIVGALHTLFCSAYATQNKIFLGEIIYGKLIRCFGLDVWIYKELHFTVVVV